MNSDNNSSPDRHPKPVVAPRDCESCAHIGSGQHVLAPGVGVRLWVYMRMRSDDRIKRCLCVAPSLTEGDKLLPNITVKAYVSGSDVVGSDKSSGLG